MEPPPPTAGGGNGEAPAAPPETAAALTQEFKARRAALAAAVKALKDAPVPPLLVQAGGDDSGKEEQKKRLDVAALGLAVLGALPPDEPAERERWAAEVATAAGNARYCRHLLETLWQPLLLRLLTLAITLTPPQGHGQHGPGLRKEGGGPPPPGMLSMADFNHLRSALELLVLWGLYPRLDEGVGVPLERRPETKAVMIPAQVLAWGLAAAEEEKREGAGAGAGGRTGGGTDDGPDDDGRLLLRLMQVLEAAMDLEQFASVFQMRLAPDLAAAYLQLVQHQSQGPGTTTTVAEEAGRRLEGLAARVGPRVMVTAMRGLLARGAAAPAWLRTACSQRMTAVLMAPGGLRAVMEAFLGGLPQQEEALQAQTRVADLLAACPRAVSPRAYLAALAPQLPPLLHAPAHDQALVHKLLALVVGKLCQKMPTETRDLLLFPLLLQPLLLLPHHPGGDEATATAAAAAAAGFDEASVGRALADLHVLLTAAPLLPAMAEVLATPQLVFPLLECWAFARRGKARGAREAEESLVALLRGVEERAHALLVDGYMSLVVDGRGRRRLAFVAGGTGGVARRWRAGKEEEEEGQYGEAELAAALGEVLGSGKGEGLKGALEHLTSLQGPGFSSSSAWLLHRHLRHAETAADEVVALLRAVGHEGAAAEEEEGRAGGMVPGQVLERLMLAYLGLKGAALTPDLVQRHCSREKWDALTSSVAAPSSHDHDGDGGAAALLLRGPALVVLLEKVAALGPAVLGSGEQILRACGMVLCLAATASEEEEEEEEGGEDGDGVGELAEVVLGLLAVLLEVGEEQRRPPEEQALQDLLPLLEGVVARHRQQGGAVGTGGQRRRRAVLLASQVVEMAVTVRAMILTRALSLEERRAARKREEAAVAARAGMSLRGLLAAVQEDVRSPMVPLRARGVVTLTKVLHGLKRRRKRKAAVGIVVVGEERETEEEEEEEEEHGRALDGVVALLLEMLRDPDSFVYLAAVQGLAVLSDKEPALVMDRLLEALSSPATIDHAVDDPAAAASTAVWQYKLKVGEALVQSLQRCGKAMPVYAPRVLPAFIKGGQPGPAMLATTARDGEKDKEKGTEEEAARAALLGAVEEEAHFRASCLSGLGDVCECLGWSLQRHVHDISGLATGILALESRRGGPLPPRGDGDDGDEDDEEEAVRVVQGKALALVRRGAAFLLERLALGLGPSRVLSVLGPSLLHEVTEAARRAAERDGDDVVRLHARRAVAAFEEALLAQLYERADPSATVTTLRELRLGERQGGVRLPGVGGNGSSREKLL